MSSFHLSFAPFVFLHPYALYSSGRCALSECCSQLPIYSESISSHLHSIVPSAPIHFRYSRFQDLVVPQCYQLSVAMYVEMISIESHLSNRLCSRILTKRILPSSCITIGYHPQDTAASFSFSDTIGFPVTYSGSHARTHGYWRMIWRYCDKVYTRIHVNRAVLQKFSSFGSTE